MTLRFSHFFLSAVAAALFVLCSLTSTAYATLDEYDFVDEEIRIEYESYHSGSGKEITTNALSGNTVDYRVYDSFTDPGVHAFIDSFYFYNDVESLVAKDYAFNISFFGLFNSVTSGNFTLALDPTLIPSYAVSVYLYDAYGESWECRDAEVTFTRNGNGIFSIDLSLPSVEKDVYKIEIRFSYGEPYFEEGVFYDTITHRVGFQGFGCNWSFQDPAAAAVPEILKQLKDLPKNIWAFFEGSFGTIIETLVELPAKIWTLIEDGLQKLFIPGEEFISEYMTLWDELLYQHLGLLYEVFYFPVEIIQVVLGFQWEQPTVSFPLVTLPFGFSFGGWDVDIVPEGFEFLFDSLKLVTSLVATLLFINAMRTRFEKLIGGDSSV